MTCLKIHASLVKAISAVLDLSETKNPNRFLISMTVAIARTIISDLSSKLTEGRAKCKKNVFRLFSFAIFGFKSKVRLNENTWL